MASVHPPQAPEAKIPAGRVRSGRLDDAELLAPPEVDPVQLSRSMFSQPAPRPPPAPLTNLHLKKVARLDANAISGDGAGADGGGVVGGGGRSGGAAARIRSARSARSGRSVAASSVRGGRAAFSVVSDEEVIDVDGEPTTLADEDLDIPPSPGAAPDDEDVVPAGPRRRGPNRGGNLGMSGIAGLAGDEYGGSDPLEDLEADTPAVRLAEVTADLEAASQASKDPWVVVHLAQMALGHAKVVWRTMPVTVREEPLLLAKAHFSLARAYQGLGCDRQASDHGKQALAAIPKEVTDTEAARALRTEVQVMRAEALLSSAGVSGLTTEAACNQARKALALLVKAAGLQEPVAWTSEEAEDNELGGIQRATIDSVSDAGIVALMAQSHGVLAEAKLKEAGSEDAERKSSLRSADEAAARLDRRTDRGDAFYSPEQLDKYRNQVQHFRDEADNHHAEVLRLAAEAERSYDAAMYCLNHVIDVEGARLEESFGREGKLAHPTFQALWRRSLDFFAGIGTAYAMQRKDALRLGIVNEILSAFAQYGTGGWLPPARHIQALKDKGALLVDRRDYESATACYEELTTVVTELFENDPVRKELQVAEVLKLRGDVALASGDFRMAQHMFNQALEFYQRHLGAQAAVAQDLLHRIDEVKGYLADTRVMGRLASLPPRQTPPPTPPPGSVAGGSSGAAASVSRSAAPSVASARSNVSRPPPLSNAGSHRISAVQSIPTAPASIRASVDGEAAVTGGGGGTPTAGSVAGTPVAMSTASAPTSQRTGLSSLGGIGSGGGGSGGGGASVGGGSQRPSSAVGTTVSAHPSITGGGRVRSSVEGFSADAGGGGGLGSSAATPPAAPASVAGSQRHGSGSDLGSHNWAATTLAAAASPVPSVRSSRTADVSAGGVHGLFAGGPPSVTALSQRSGYGQGSGYGRVASPAAQSQRSGFDGGAASPTGQSQHSGFGAAGSGGGYDGGAASPEVRSHRSGYGNAATSPVAQSHRSGYGGYGGGPAASVSQSLHSADFSNLRGFESVAGSTSQPRASGVIDEDDEGVLEDADEGAIYSGHASSASPSIASAARRLAGSSGELGGGAAASASPSARSQRSGARGSGALDGMYSGAASPAAQSQRSGYGSGYGYGGGSGAYNGNYGSTAAPAPPSQRSGEYTGFGRTNSGNSFRGYNNDPMDY
ncbi:hypothetical protein VaNZ11_009565 [Volvox africanus]|uniref:Uncharacterized protein n=1 Tax=Volvox africanus TaxID=51714 RepID=A0ABQ5S9P4_9CHLO|nr:hypothetical protein VaNZ11_009565 [Volvox africanus]